MEESNLGKKKKKKKKNTCQKSGFRLASEILRITHGDPLQSANTFPVMASRLNSNSLLHR